MSAGSSNHGGPSATVSAVSTPINAGSRPDSAPALGSSQASTPPNSGTKFLDVKAQEDKKSRRTSLQMLLPKLPSSDSAGPSPGPSSPGISGWNDNSPKIESGFPDKNDAAKLNRKESYKAQRKNYRREKKRVASELLNSLQDPAVIVLADWLKIRGTLKSWTKLWCVLKPGLLFIYKSPKTKSSHWVGTVLLTSCQVIERPSKKDGFCFKLFHPLDQSIWAPRGPDKETMGAVVQPLPTSYLIFRAPSQAAGKCWMDALELSLRCSALLVRSVPSIDTTLTEGGASSSTHETQWSEADYEKHFDEHVPKLKEHLSYLLKYLPPSPPDKRNLRVEPIEKSLPRSACPSPTPIFQQLYLAVAHWERYLSDSPDLLRCQSVDFGRGGGARHQSTSSSPGADEVFDDGGDVSGTMLMAGGRRRNSFQVGCRLDSSDTATGDEHHGGAVGGDGRSIHAIDSGKLRRRSSPANFAKAHGITIRVSDDQYLDIDSQLDQGTMVSAGESDSESDLGDGMDVEEFPETPYVHSSEEEFGAAGEQVEELPEEHKSLIWFLVKQVRPGMDLSKVVLPTFILEPRSFLDKLADSYYHADILSKAVLEDDPFTRMKTVVQWYLSGFYKKPKGLKKPYNPILGETFRCYWQHENGSRTFYIAEQVSHHPPVSVFYVTNRQDGFCISCSILAKSKFYGNSTSAILEGVATLTLLPRGESYTLTVPYAHCKGILMGTLSMELGGKVTIECENTGYKTELEFKLKPFLGGNEYTNLLVGKLKLGKETLATINGHWDGEIRIKDTRSNEESLLFNATPEVRAKRLKRFTVPMESQGMNESERLWQHVSAAIHRDDQVGATEEKTALEEAQRISAKERKATCTEWVPLLFQQDFVTGQWHYKYADLRPWDPRNDLRQYESNYRIQTKTRHQAPMVRTASVVSTDPLNILQADSRGSLRKKRSGVMKTRKISSNTSTPDLNDPNSDSSHSDEHDTVLSSIRIMQKLDDIHKQVEEHSKKLCKLQLDIDKLRSTTVSNFGRRDSETGWEGRLFPFLSSVHVRTVVFMVIGLVLQVLITWFLTKRSLASGNSSGGSGGSD
ncbi:oxysterol-binding protein-related protein 8-like isoform X1 [Anopheles albimanus]|uniref:oxysterol-binding protein-related protein 8-like isoform X1 n=1 Tax=Anopheles albimanus TaxID=7167 RepID=UPI0016410682|nr:oxysterol-binding protein-related protein 8-like isoform X1 [Anopheles albimanus]XP_035779936.1 oxysterol-binding protein-related protein 8-like isoform X1 [Anopheles albimanus]XP_035779937.1 oxysterol-binding protein-related protein 8-like isoform X1 [Anopheles albimanus]XP_035779938.1 oxysterol-binding protein-related protein 8-like isoform X1 [Anopheles albimanus]XP_035779939.1 oxysterol-binding protein-related protein 8-like isoform X1 [Anopheles albimanus]